jgi:hypothetical protein
MCNFNRCITQLEWVAKTFMMIVADLRYRNGAAFFVKNVLPRVGGPFVPSVHTELI